jgi:hypothetical protein
VISADIDLKAQAESRGRFPALDNRQLGLSKAAAVRASNAATVLA